MTSPRRPRRSRTRRPDAAARRRRRVISILIMVALAVLIGLDHAGLLLGQHDEARRYDGVKANVIRVIDGDTFVVDLPDSSQRSSSTRVRVWGIDAPEMGRPDKPAEPLALDATALARELLEGRTVVLAIERSRIRGRWGRLLAHVRLDNGDLFAMDMLRAGLVRADTRWPHRWLAEFDHAEQEARQRRVGLWAR